jgi:hypothetical protein
VKLFLLIIITLLFAGCAIQKGEIIDKQKTEYSESKRIDRDDQYHTECHTVLRIDYKGRLRSGQDCNQIYDYTLCREYLVKNYPDYIIKIKNKKDTNIFYINKNLFDDLKIGDFYDNKEWNYPSCDKNNVDILLREWKE